MSRAGAAGQSKSKTCSFGVHSTRTGNYIAGVPAPELKSQLHAVVAFTESCASAHLSNRTAFRHQR
jgi:hypothetical protein